ncbi:sulfotransferase [Wenzhouxiangella marina]|uniref:Uncharacterized protein n=1 Tax=Wenzhouxiangella marina TaxID=1579979 RepID=A0A0K0XV69_9GAMM|nr:sulfotransferase [Wenzhouxiangella marina]AKS41516.1 hypothetical protein WM2015_1142 [Wenzhouxiangella marina]MBB6086725.1 hypothetical protein [Wenzhouxiangella marina]
MLHSLAPLLIAAPAPRSGTTLLQRLLCSSPEALIYGESVAHDLNLFISMLHNKAMVLSTDQGQHQRQFDAVLSGEVNDWIADLHPGGDWILERFAETVRSYLESHAELAARHGRRRWGAKLPAWPPPMLAQLLEWMPDARLLYIVRNPEDTVRSARLIGACKDLQGIADFVEAWRDHQTEVMRRCPGNRVLWIDYGRLCDEPEPMLQTIEAFAGVGRIDADVLAHRINDHDRRHQAPAPLSDEEQQWVRSRAGDPADRPRGSTHE